MNGNDRWEAHATRFTETNPSGVHVDARVGCMDGRNGWEDAWVGSHGPLRSRLLAQVFQAAMCSSVAPAPLDESSGVRTKT